MTAESPYEYTQTGLPARVIIEGAGGEVVIGVRTDNDAGEVTDGAVFDRWTALSVAAAIVRAAFTPRVRHR